MNFSVFMHTYDHYSPNVLAIQLVAIQSDNNYQVSFLQFAHSVEQWQALMTNLSSGQFCFVQAENGRVVEIFYEQRSNPDGVNLKKSIAAAFQANFKNQKEEEEEDPQSLHRAHYR